MSCFFRVGRGWLAGIWWAGLAVGPATGQTPAPGIQCAQLPIAPAERALKAALIVEGQVMNGQGFWDAAHQHILTRHQLRVFRVLKGTLPDTTLTLLTEGGQVDLRRETLSNTLQLSAGQQGVFFLTPAPGSAGAGPAWLAYGSAQGFIRYDQLTGTAADPFRSYPAIDEAFYRQVAGPAPRQVLAPARSWPALRTPTRGTQALVISGLTPERLTAGTGAVLTISGSGFGANRGAAGRVEFANADDGGRSFTPARPDDYLSWTDTQIQVRVPSLSPENHPAGSGAVRITPDGQMPVLSPQLLTVVYALANAQSSQDNQLDRPAHVSQNGRGGLSFQLAPDFRASAAAAAWRRALSNWRCQTGVNWEEDLAPAPSSTAANDQHNTISFDGAAALPAGVLGRTTSYYTGCYGPDGNVIFTVAEIDMQFSSATSFQFGPALTVRPDIDFETVAVHELGHAQQLAHLNLPGAVMHYAVARGQNTRQLNPSSDVAGGRQVLRSRSFVRRGCSGAPMLPAPISSLVLDAATPALSWSTRDECFLSEFVVERSLGPDTLAWQAVATVPAGNVGAGYRYADAQPAPGLHYYRLRLHRPEGSLDSTAPIAFSPDLAAGSLQVLPNPVSGDQLRLLYPARAAGTLALAFYDELGRYHQARAVAVQAELNVLGVNITDLPPGFYVLTWRDTQSGQHGSQRLVRE